MPELIQSDSPALRVIVPAHGLPSNVYVHVEGAAGQASGICSTPIFKNPLSGGSLNRSMVFE